MNAMTRTEHRMTEMSTPADEPASLATSHLHTWLLAGIRCCRHGTSLPERWHSYMDTTFVRPLSGMQQHLRVQNMGECSWRLCPMPPDNFGNWQNLFKFMLSPPCNGTAAPSLPYFLMGWRGWLLLFAFLHRKCFLRFRRQFLPLISCGGRVPIIYPVPLRLAA